MPIDPKTGKYIRPQMKPLDMGQQGKPNPFDAVSTLQKNQMIRNMTGMSDSNEGMYFTDIPYEEFESYVGDITFDETLGELQEERATNQSNLEKLGNGFAKMGITAGTTFLDGTIGTAVGLGNMFAEGQVSGFWQNPFSEALHQYLNEANEKFENYRTQAEQNAGLGERMTTMNWWADNILQNSGFMIGMLATGALTGGGIMSAGNARQIARRIGKHGMKEVIENPDDVIKMVSKGKLRTSDLIDGFKKDASYLQNLNNTSQVVSSVAASLGEARIEALSSVDELEQSMRDQGLLEGKTPEEIEEIKRAHGNIIFGLNTALLAGSNYTQFRQVFGGGYDFAKRNLSYTREFLEDGSSRLVAKKMNPLQKIGAIGKYPLTEGVFEEGGQYAIQKGSEDFTVSRTKDPEARSILNSIIESTTTGLSETFGSTEGLENMIVGAIIGSAGIVDVTAPIREGKFRFNQLLPQGGIRQGVQDIKAYNRQADQANQDIAQSEDNLKSQYSKMTNQIKEFKGLLSKEEPTEEDAKRIKSLADEITAAISYQIDMSKAAKKNDILNYKDFENKEFTNNVIGYLETGHFEDFIQKLDTSERLSGEQLREVYQQAVENSSGEVKTVDPFEGFSATEIEEYQRDRVKKLKDRAKRVRELYRDVSIKTGNQLNREANKELITQIATLEDQESRINTMTQEIKDYFSDINLDKSLTKKQKEALHNDIKADENLKIYAEETPEKTIKALNDARASASVIEEIVAQKLEDPDNKDIDKLDLLAQIKENYGSDPMNTAKDIRQKIGDILELQATRNVVAQNIKNAFQNPQAFTMMVEEEKKKAEKKFEQKVKKQEEETQDTTEETPDVPDDVPVETFTEDRIEELSDEPKYDPSKLRVPFLGFKSFFRTTGNQEDLSSDDPQKTWFAFRAVYPLWREEGKIDEKVFRTFTIDQLPNELAGVKFYNEESNEYLTKAQIHDRNIPYKNFEKDIKVVVMNSSDMSDAYKLEGELVYSSMQEPTYRYKDGTQEGDYRFSFEKYQETFQEITGRKATQEEIDEDLEQSKNRYNEFRNLAKSQSKILEITGVTPGVKVYEDNLEDMNNEVVGSVVPNESHIKNLQIDVVRNLTNKERRLGAIESPDGSTYDNLPIGAAVLFTTGRPQILTPKILSEEDVQRVLDLTSYMARKEDMFTPMRTFLDQLLNMYTQKNSPYQMRIIEDSGKIARIYFGNTSITAEELQNTQSEGFSKFKQFLSNKRYNISSKGLNQGKFTEWSIEDGKPVSKTWNADQGGYKGFLFSSEDNNTKATIKLKPLPLSNGEIDVKRLAEEPQFLNSQFTYDFTDVEETTFEEEVESNQGEEVNPYENLLLQDESDVPEDVETTSTEELFEESTTPSQEDQWAEKFGDISEIPDYTGGIQQSEVSLPYDSQTKSGKIISELDITKKEWESYSREKQQKIIECN